MNGAGTVQCTVNGKVTFSPPLKAGALVATTATAVAKFTCSTGQTGSAAVVRGGKFTAVSTSVGMSCTAANIAEVNGSIRWTSGGGRVLPSTMNLGAGSDLTGFRFTTSAIGAGSYTSQPMEVIGDVTAHVRQARDQEGLDQRHARHRSGVHHEHPHTQRHHD